MGLKTETVDIDGYTYKIRQLKLKKSRSLLIKITNVLGPAIGDAVTGDTEGFTVDANSLGDAVKTLAVSLDERDFETVQNTLFEQVWWINSSGDELPLKAYVEDHFEGGEGLGRLLKVLGAALRVNYSDFLAGLGLGDLFQVKDRPDNPQTSTGTSGDS